MANKVVTIALVAVVIAGAAGAVVLSGVLEQKEANITIIDGAGKKISLDEPLTKVVIANTNIPKMCKIIGATEQVTGLSFYSGGSNDSNWAKFSPHFPNAKHMSLETLMTAEEIIQVADAVIVPVSSMTITGLQEKSFNEMGITVIRLNCNGDTAQEDMEKLTILFGKTAPIIEKYNEYWSLYNGVKDTVVNKVKTAGGFEEKRFLYYYSGLDSFYNQASASSSLVENIFGKNILRDIDGLDLTKISNDASQIGMVEKITTLDAANPTDYLFFRGASSTHTTSDAATLFEGSTIMSKYDSLSPLSTGKVYLFNSEIMSGCLSYVAYVYIAEILGVDTGYNPATLITEYNDKYGFGESTTGLAFQITVSGTTASAAEIVIS